MNWLRSVLLLAAAGMGVLLCSSASASSGADLPSTKNPQKSCATFKVLDSDSTNVSAISPDGKYTVCVKENYEDKDGAYTYTSVYLSRNGHTRRLGRYKDMTSTGNLLWAPDSSAFAWNFTYGGASSGWTTIIFDLKASRFFITERTASRDFHRRLLKACKEDETDDNVYLLKWVDARSILIAVEAHPGGLDCRDPAPTEFYQVAAPSGRILKYLQGAEKDAVERDYRNGVF